MNDIEGLLSKIENAKELDFGDILSRSFELFKKTWVKGFLLLSIILIVAIPFMIAVYLPMIAEMKEGINKGDFDPNETGAFLRGQPDNFRFMILGITFVVSFLSTALVGAFYKIIRKIDFSEEVAFIDFFYFFKSKYLGKIFAIASFSLLASLINFVFEKFLPPTTASLLGGLLSIILSVYTTLFVVFLAFHPELETGDFFVLSFNLGSKKWFLIFGLMLVMGMLGCLGFVACGFGVLFTISIVYLPVYFVYKDIIGFSEVDEIDNLGMPS